MLAGLDTIPPGCVLGAMLDDIDLDRCTGFDRIRVLRAEQRMASHYQARSYHTMTAVLEVIDATDIGQPLNSGTTQRRPTTSQRR